MQCAKRLYLEYHHPEEVPEPTVGRQALQEAGARLLELACQGFPKGRRVDACSPYHERRANHPWLQPPLYGWGE